MLLNAFMGIFTQAPKTVFGVQTKKSTLLEAHSEPPFTATSSCLADE